MKRLLTIFLILLSVTCSAQFGNQLWQGSAKQLTGQLGAVGSEVGIQIRSNFIDTLAANSSFSGGAVGFLKNIKGFIIRVGDTLFIRSEDLQRWVKIGSGSGGGGGSGTVTNVTGSFPITITSTSTLTPNIKADTTKTSQSLATYYQLKQKYDSSIHLGDTLFYTRSPIHASWDTVIDKFTLFLDTVDATHDGQLLATDWIRFNSALQPADTTGQWITSMFRRVDSVFYVKSGASIFAYLDSTGGGGGIDNPWTVDYDASGHTLDSLGILRVITHTGTPGTITYTTLDPANKTAQILSGGNLTATHQSVGGSGSVSSILGVSSGKWYWEITITTANGVQAVGVYKAPDDQAQIPGQEANTYAYWNTGDFFNANSAHGSPASWVSGDVIGVALDMNAGTLIFYKNGVSQGTAFTGLTGTFYALVGGQDNTPLSVLTANFGATTLTPPSGYNAGLYTSSGSGVVYNEVLRTDSMHVYIGNRLYLPYYAGSTGGIYVNNLKYLKADVNGNNSIGFSSGSDSATAANNIIFGNGSGQKLNGFGNVLMGYHVAPNMAGFDGSQAGSRSVIIGYEAGLNATGGSHNIAIGTGSGQNLDSLAESNLMIGKGAGAAMRHSIGDVFLGSSVAYTGNYSGSGYNTVTGADAFLSPTSARYNSLYGAFSGTGITSGYENVVMGYSAGASLTKGYKNTFLGGYAGYLQDSGAFNAYIGYQANANETTYRNYALFIDTHGDGSNRALIGGFGNTRLLGINKTLDEITADGYTFQVHGTSHFDSTVKIDDSLIINIPTKGAGKFLTSDANGAATWATPSTVATAVPLSGITRGTTSNTVSNAGNAFTIDSTSDIKFIGGNRLATIHSELELYPSGLQAIATSVDGTHPLFFEVTNASPSLGYGVTKKNATSISVDATNSGGPVTYVTIDSNHVKEKADTATFTVAVGVGINKTPSSALDVTGTTKSTQFAATYQTLTDASTITWNANSGSNATVTIAATGRTLSITNPVTGTYYTVKIIQDGGGSKTITTWPTNTKWPGGVAPTLTTAANAVDIICFYYDGTNYYANYNYDFK